MRYLFKRLIVSFLLISLQLTSTAQDSILLQQAEVRASRSPVSFNQTARSVTVISRAEIENSPAKTLNELLEYSSNVDIRQRGQNGVQADVSIRGSSFEQVLVLLNGIKMTDPQTGHHSLNLPISLLDIERIEIIKGGASRVFGPGAFAGAINIITKNPASSQARIQALAGEHGLRNLGGAVSLVQKKHSHSLSLSNQQSDGFIRNSDYKQNNVLWQSDFRLKNGNIFLNMGQNNKAFGAQNFYTTRFPNQFEETTSQFIGLGAGLKWGKLSVEPKTYMRRHMDRFELFREGSSYYSRLPNKGGFQSADGETFSWYKGHNYHQTTVYGAELNLAYTSKIGKTSIGFDFRREELLSNNLGEIRDKEISVKDEHPSAAYTRDAFRENRTVFVEHNVLYKNLYISAGALMNLNSDFGQHFSPGIDASYQLISGLRAFASYSQSFRFPTYTDLYYNLGGAKGSINLKPEESTNYEVGLKSNGKGNYASISGFLREGENLIDWISYPGSNLTQAANLTEVDMSGIEFEYVAKANSWLNAVPFLNQIRFSYSFMQATDNTANFESNYVLDYLRQKMDLSSQVKLSSLFFLDWNLSYQDRNGKYLDADGFDRSYKAVMISDMKLAFKRKNLNLYMQVSNLFDQRYFDIGNVENPGRWISFGLDYTLPFKKKAKQSI